MKRVCITSRYAEFISVDLLGVVFGCHKGATRVSRVNITLEGNMKTTVITAAILAVFGTAAAADGLYVSGTLSAQTFGHEIERNTEAALGAPDQSFVTRTEDTGAGLGFALGYEQSINSSFYWGAEVFYNASDASSTNINGVLVTDVDVDATYGVRGIFGTNVTDKVQLYAHAGVTQVDFDINNSYTFAPPVTTRSDEETAFSYGFGAAVAVTDNLSVFSEYTQISGVSFDGIPEVAGGTNRVNDNTLDLSSVAVGVKISF
ncbi:outer membrane beta-barrel protein [Octadecabacter sp.]|nr:outer membrane beta-barrel protein [Octadecabacter sp.]